MFRNILEAEMVVSGVSYFYLKLSCLHFFKTVLPGSLAASPLFLTYQDIIFTKFTECVCRLVMENIVQDFIHEACW